jgi:hypothetical protein
VQDLVKFNAIRYLLQKVMEYPPIYCFLSSRGNVFQNSNITVDKPPEIVFYANDTPDTLRMSSKVHLRIEITLQLTVLLVRLRYDSIN